MRKPEGNSGVAPLTNPAASAHSRGLQPHAPPNKPKFMNTFFLRLLFFAALVSAALAQNAGAPRQNSGQNTPAGTGAIEGRVLNGAKGQYLNNARVTVPGTSLQTFTNSYGEFRLTGVPVGTATVQVFYTGIEPQSAAVNVVADTTVAQNITVG